MWSILVSPWPSGFPCSAASCCWSKGVESSRAMLGEGAVRAPSLVGPLGDITQSSIHIVEDIILVASACCAGSRRDRSCLGLVGGGVPTEGVEIDVWLALHACAHQLSQLPPLCNCDTVP
eukprot:4803024-Pyramimonas_sp.AAC.1